jgi:hypothetical protein
MKTTVHLLTVTSTFLLLSTGCARTQAAPPETASAAAPVARPAPPPAPRQEVAQAPAGPALNSKEIRVAVSGISDDLQQCYLAGTFKDSSLAGTVHVTFTIEPTGRVSSAVDSGSDMADPDVVECVIDCFAGLSFRPGGQNATEVSYPIRFNRRS